MKIDNHTHYQKRQLMAFVRKAERMAFFNARLWEKWKRKRKHFTVRVEYTRQHHGCSGCAYLNSFEITVRVPKFPTREKLWNGTNTTLPNGNTKWEAAEEGPAFRWVERGITKYIKRDLAMVMVHEFAHSRGLNHADMRGCSLYNRTGNWEERYAWAGDLPLEPRPAPVKTPKPSLDETRQARLDHALAKAAEWDRKAATASTRAATWKRKARALKAAGKRAAKGAAPA